MKDIGQRLLRLGALSGVGLAAVAVLGMSGTTQVAWPGKPVAASADWPEGVLELANDPLRTQGWNPWFSEWPNDVNLYAYALEGTNDVNRLIAKLAAIKGANTRVLLYPDKEARALGFTTVLKEGNGAAVVFSIGSQRRINEWYQHLREEEPGVRIFGVHRYREPPKAQPPTLALHVGNATIDLKSLKIPDSVMVQAVVSEAERAAQTNAALIKAIDELIASRQTKPARQAHVQLTPGAGTGLPAAGGLAHGPGTDTEHAAWVQSCLTYFAALKPGMTRQEVERKFGLDGGLQSASPVRFCHPACPYFKIDVEFEYGRDPAAQGRAITGTDDKVIRVSKPYLEAPFMD